MRLLREGLRPNDLEDMIFDKFEIDAFESKMGDDRDVCVLSFKARERNPARDMMEFIEKGYGYVLDADVSSGEDTKGYYHVFVELPRTTNLPKQIKEIVEGIKNLTAIESWKFKYYKDHKTHELSEESISSVIPMSAGDYDMMLENIRVESIQRFFSKTYKETIVVEGNRITINKPFGVKVSFDLVSFGSRDDLQADLTETMKLDTKSAAETMWLTKILGDFNISKYGESFVLENGKKAMKIRIDR